MKKVFFTLLLILPLYAMGQEIEENILLNKTYLERSAYFKQNPLEEGQIIFFGNSLTQGHNWGKDFPEKNIANRGIIGDNTEGMLARMHEIIAAKPTILFFMAGVNDMSLNRSNEVILRNVKMLLRQVQAGSPDTKIYVQSCLPINAEKLKYQRMKGKQQQIVSYNISLQELCNEMEITYLDIYDQLIIDPLTLNPTYTTDGLHLTKPAYDVWVEYIRKFIIQ